MFDTQKYDHFIDIYLRKEVVVRKRGNILFIDSVWNAWWESRRFAWTGSRGISTNSGMSPPWEVANEQPFGLSLVSLSLSRERFVEIDGNEDEIRIRISMRFLNFLRANEITISSIIRNSISNFFPFLLFSNEISTVQCNAWSKFKYGETVYRIYP